MTSTPRWGGLRLEPYDPDADDADGDGIVQEQTAWERPKGTTLADRSGNPIQRGATSASRDPGTRVMRNGKEERYTPTYGGQGQGKPDKPVKPTPLADAGSPSLRERGISPLSDRLGSIRSIFGRSRSQPPQSTQPEQASKPTPPPVQSKPKPASIKAITNIINYTPFFINPDMRDESLHEVDESIPPIHEDLDQLLEELHDVDVEARALHRRTDKQKDDETSKDIDPTLRDEIDKRAFGDPDSDDQSYLSPAIVRNPDHEDMKPSLTVSDEAQQLLERVKSVGKRIRNQVARMMPEELKERQKKAIAERDRLVRERPNATFRDVENLLDRETTRLLSMPEHRYDIDRLLSSAISNWSVPQDDPGGRADQLVQVSADLTNAFRHYAFLREFGDESDDTRLDSFERMLELTGMQVPDHLGRPWSPVRAKPGERPDLPEGTPFPTRVRFGTLDQHPNYKNRAEGVRQRVLDELRRNDPSFDEKVATLQRWANAQYALLDEIDAIALAKREYFHAVMQSLRATGRGDLKWTMQAGVKPGPRAVIDQALSDATDVLPVEWMNAASRTLGALRVEDSTRAGFTSDITASDGSKVAVLALNSNGRSPLSQAVHELTHAAEDGLPELAMLQAIFLNSRIKPGDDPVEEAPGEFMLGDEFFTRYAGRLYRNSTPAGHQSSYEILSVGIEKLLGETTTPGVVSMDEDYEDFVLGVFASIGRSRSDRFSVADLPGDRDRDETAERAVAATESAVQDEERGPDADEAAETPPESPEPTTPDAPPARRSYSSDTGEPVAATQQAPSTTPRPPAPTLMESGPVRPIAQLTTAQPTWLARQDRLPKTTAQARRIQREKAKRVRSGPPLQAPAGYVRKRGRGNDFEDDDPDGYDVVKDTMAADGYRRGDRGYEAELRRRLRARDLSIDSPVAESEFKDKPWLIYGEARPSGLERRPQPTVDLESGDLVDAAADRPGPELDQPEDMTPEPPAREPTRLEQMVQDANDRREVLFADLPEDPDERSDEKARRVVAAIQETGGFFRPSDMSRSERRAWMAAPQQQNSLRGQSFTFNEGPPERDIDEGIDRAMSRLDQMITEQEAINSDMAPKLRRLRERLASMSKDEIRAEVAGRIRRGLEDEDTRIAVAANFDKISAMIDDGRYKTTHDSTEEVRLSGQSQGDIRRELETMHGLPARTGAELRPSSGFLLFGDRRRQAAQRRRPLGDGSPIGDVSEDSVRDSLGAAKIYGSSMIVLRRGARGRTKFGAADSLNAGFDPSPMENPSDDEILRSIFAHVGGKRFHQGGEEPEIDVLAAILERDGTLGLGVGHDLYPSDGADQLTMHSPYFETLTYGSFDLGDIEEIHIATQDAIERVAANELRGGNNMLEILSDLADDDELNDPAFRSFVESVKDLSEFDPTRADAEKKIRPHVAAMLTHRRIRDMRRSLDERNIVLRATQSRTESDVTDAERAARGVQDTDSIRMLRAREALVGEIGRQVADVENSKEALRRIMQGEAIESSTSEPRAAEQDRPGMDDLVDDMPAAIEGPKDMAATVQSRTSRLYGMLAAAGGFFGRSTMTPEEREEWIEQRATMGLRVGRLQRGSRVVREQFDNALAQLLSDHQRDMNLADGMMEKDSANALNMRRRAAIARRTAATLMRLGPDGLQRELVDRIEATLDDPDTRVAVSMKPEFLDDLLGVGRWRTTHEVTHGASDRESRVAIETTLGIPPDAPTEVRPASGFVLTGDRRRKSRAAFDEPMAKRLRDKGYTEEQIRAIRSQVVTREERRDSQGTTAGYGDVMIVLHPDVAERSTVQFGDSLNAPTAPTPMRNASREEIADAFFGDRYRAGSQKRPTEKIIQIAQALTTDDGVDAFGRHGSQHGGRPGLGDIDDDFSLSSWNYLETQTLGAFSVDEIAEIYIPEKVWDPSPRFSLGQSRERMLFNLGEMERSGAFNGKAIRSIITHIVGLSDEDAKNFADENSYFFEVGRISARRRMMTDRLRASNPSMRVMLERNDDDEIPSVAILERLGSDDIFAARSARISEVLDEMVSEIAEPTPVLRQAEPDRGDLLPDPDRDDAERLGVSLSAYLDEATDDEDVKWSSGDWALGKTQHVEASDAVIVREGTDGLEVLMIDRAFGPFTGAKALPGGLKDPGERFEVTADREMEEEVGVSANDPKVKKRTPLGVIADAAGWDPRFVEGVSVGAVRYDVDADVDVVAASDAVAAQWVSVEDLASGKLPIAFGHTAWLAAAFADDPSYSERFALLSRAARRRNRRLITKINEIRREKGAKTFAESADSPWIPVAETIEPEGGTRSAEPDRPRSETPAVKAPSKPPRYPRQPPDRTMTGLALERFGKARTWREFREAMRTTDVVFLDYETTGLDFDEFGQPSSNGLPVQIGAVRMRDGKVIERFNVFVNPGVPMSEWQPWSRDNLVDGEGRKFTDEFFDDKPDIAEAHRRLIEFIGNETIVGMQNAVFDDQVLSDALRAAGIDWRPAGTIDTKEMASMVLPVWTPDNQDAPSKVDPKTGERVPSNSLGDITKFLGVELGDKHHSADYDAQATGEVLTAIVDGAIDKGWPDDFLDGKKRDAKIRQNETEFNREVAKFEKDKADWVASQSSESETRSAEPDRPGFAITRTNRPAIESMADSFDHNGYKMVIRSLSMPSPDEQEALDSRGAPWMMILQSRIMSPDGEVAGTAILDIFSGENTLNLRDITIRPEHRQKGVGGALFTHIADSMRSTGVAAIRLAAVSYVGDRYAPGDDSEEKPMYGAAVWHRFGVEFDGSQEALAEQMVEYAEATGHAWPDGLIERVSEGSASIRDVVDADPGDFLNGARVSAGWDGILRLDGPDRNAGTRFAQPERDADDSMDDAKRQLSDAVEAALSNPSAAGRIGRTAQAPDLTEGNRPIELKINESLLDEISRGFEHNGYRTATASSTVRMGTGQLGNYLYHKMRILAPDGSIVGAVYLSGNLDTRDLHLTTIEINQNHQGNGVGGALFRHIARAARDMGMERITLTAASGPPTSTESGMVGAAVWGRLGFEFEGPQEVLATSMWSYSRKTGYEWPGSLVRRVRSGNSSIREVMDADPGDFLNGQVVEVLWQGAMDIRQMPDTDQAMRQAEPDRPGDEIDLSDAVEQLLRAPDRLNIDARGETPRGWIRGRSRTDAEIKAENRSLIRRLTQLGGEWSPTATLQERLNAADEDRPDRFHDDAWDAEQQRRANSKLKLVGAPIVLSGMVGDGVVSVEELFDFHYAQIEDLLNERESLQEELYSLIEEVETRLTDAEDEDAERSERRRLEMAQRQLEETEYEIELLGRAYDLLTSKGAQGFADLVSGRLRAGLADPDTRAAISMPASREQIQGLLRTGVFLTAHDGVETDHVAADFRRVLEMTHGIPYGAPSSVRPASGFVLWGDRRRRLSTAIAEEMEKSSAWRTGVQAPVEENAIRVHAEMGRAGQYGSMQIVLKRAVAGRAKFGLGDSYDDQFEPAAMVGASDEEISRAVLSSSSVGGIVHLANALSDETGTTLLNPRAFSDPLAGDSQEDYYSGQYQEALVYGSFDIADIEQIDIPFHGVIAAIIPEGNQGDSRLAGLLNRLRSLGVLDEILTPELISGIDSLSMTPDQAEALYSRLDYLLTLAASDYARNLFRRLNPDIKVNVFFEDGTYPQPPAMDRAEMEGGPNYLRSTESAFARYVQLMQPVISDLAKRLNIS